MLNFFLHLLNQLEKAESLEDVSFHLDQLQDTDLFTDRFIEGFEFGGGDTAVTNGLWMWSRPFLHRDKHGREVAILLIDVEGNGEAKGGSEEGEDACLDAELNSIATCISSVQVSF